MEQPEEAGDRRLESLIDRSRPQRNGENRDRVCDQDAGSELQPRSVRGGDWHRSPILAKEKQGIVCASAVGRNVVPLMA